MWNLEFAGFSPPLRNLKMLFFLASIISGEKSRVVIFIPLYVVPFPDPTPSLATFKNFVFRFKQFDDNVLWCNYLSVFSAWHFLQDQ